ncbi:hypothetical protein DMENIID0001_165670 [Sergentomyia squamirostris]
MNSNIPGIKIESPESFPCITIDSDTSSDEVVEIKDESQSGEHSSGFQIVEVDNVETKDISDKNTVNCIVCKREFEPPEKVSRTPAVPTESKSIKCPFCRKTIPSEYSLIFHIESQHRSSQMDFQEFSLPCPICSEICETIDSLEEHIIKHTRKRTENIKCPGCRESEKHDHKLNVPCPKCSKVMTRECLICLKQFENNQKLVCHMKKKHDTKFKCPVCSRDFELKKKMLEHLVQDHNDPKPYKCPQCPRGYKGERRLKRHVEIHGPNGVQCRVCGQPFRNVEILENHMRRHHQMPPLTFECCHCGVTYKRKQHLKMHMVLHSKDGLYTCLVCLKQYFSKKKLAKHLRVHDDNPIKCRICHRRFSHEGFLNRHMRIHSKRQIFECPHSLCYKQFRIKENFQAHLELKHQDRRRLKSTEDEVEIIIPKEEIVVIKEEVDDESLLTTIVKSEYGIL